MSTDLERRDRSFAVFVLGYLALFVGWYWWALRSENPISAVVFVVPESTAEPFVASAQLRSPRFALAPIVGR